MTPDPRWLEVLKASGWQSAAIASACGLFLLVARWGWVPPLEPWMVQLAMAGLLLFGFLSAASLITAMNKFFPVQTWVVHWVKLHREKTAARNYIPHMTEKERQIVGYLLAKNQKMCTAESSGGNAMTLISQGIVVRALRPGQVFDFQNTPMAIPDHIWDVLVQHKDHFPPPDDDEGHPWRVHWMAR